MLWQRPRWQLQLEHKIGVVPGGGEAALAFHGAVDWAVVEMVGDTAAVALCSVRRSNHGRQDHRWEV